MTNTDSTADFQTVTERQQAMWASGDFNIISLQTMPISETLVRSVDPRAGQRVLDLACGSGNAALVAGRRFCDVTGIDYVPALIERAKVRSTAEGTDIDFQVADAQALPFADASFDVVLSAIGVMFAPDQQQAADELLRVCRPSGRIGLASWIPGAFGGDLFGVLSSYAPPPPGLQLPTRWGTSAGLNDLIGDEVTIASSEQRIFYSYYTSPLHAVDVLCKWFGPAIRASEAVGPDGQAELRNDMEGVFNTYNRGTDGTAVIESEYLETIAVRA